VESLDSRFRGNDGFCVFDFRDHMTHPPIIDGHNDVLLRLWLKRSVRAAEDFVEGDGLGHMDLPRIRAGNMAGGFFAIFSPSQADYHHDDDDLNPPYDSGVAQKTALASAEGMLDLRDRIVALAGGAVVLCATSAELRAAMVTGKLGWITHIEGAEAIAPDLSNLQALYDRGLRSIGPVWSRINGFGEGVPFRFPSSPDTGKGLTDAGKALVRECNRLRIMIDVSHLNERGFWDVAALSSAPLVATHSNAHELSASSRNLTNEQLLAIRDSGGMVGLNYATGFLRGDGRWDSLTDISVMVRHVEHLLRYAGEDNVGLGSDFDGARIPAVIGNVMGGPKLLDALVVAGFDARQIEKVAHGNWLRVLEKTWGA
jgi:membrane dipeptidase